jgi:membrane fusion protein
VSALTARMGHPVNAQTPLMTILPASSALQAELVIPSSAIGFVKTGQDVRLAIDAFPYQRFGTLKGKVLTVATSAVAAQGPNNSSISVYPVTIVLDRTSVAAYGRNERLVAGMTLTARIVTDKQTLLEWLFEPLYAVRRR